MTTSKLSVLFIAGMKADTFFSAIANQESLSVLEVEMRKLEAVTREIVDELGYLQRREMRMRDTNGQSFCCSVK